MYLLYGHQREQFMLLVANLINTEWYKNGTKMTDSAQRELPNEYQHDRV